MGTFIFITGGARSGKSSFAVSMAKTIGKRITFVATCVPEDTEMKERVKKHRQERPKTWKTVEEPYDLAKALKHNGRTTDVFIVDCLTLWLSNIVLAGKSEKGIMQRIDKLARTIRSLKSSVILISNEVGSGIVPENKLARDFRDTAGKMNQFLARKSDEAYCLVSGIPIKLK